MEMLFVIEVNGSIERFESLIETQKRVNELRKRGVKFDIYKTITFDGVTEKSNNEEVKEMEYNGTVEEKIMTDLMKVVKKLGNGYNGKRVGNDIYIYSECLPYGYLGRYKKALRVIEKKYDSEVLNKKHVVRFNTKNDDDISIMEVKNFDTEREPTIGNSYKIDLDTNSATFTKEKNNPYIYHHKWMFVSDNYNRFDIEESKLWSIKWKKTLPKGRKTTSSIGYLKQWNNFLNEYGLEVEEKNNTNKFLDVVLNGGIVEKYNRYYKYNTKEKRFYYTDYSINNNWKKSNMNIKDFCDIDWNIV